MKDNYCKFGCIRLAGVLCICMLHYKLLLATSSIISNKFPITAMIFDFLATYGARFVFFFFLLSGYNISRRYLMKNVLSEDFTEFFLKQLRKLLPITIFSTLIMTILQLIYYFMNKSWWTDRAATVSNVIGNIWGGQSILPMQFGDTINGPTWYIYSLLICYIIFWFVHKKCDWFYENCAYFILAVLSLGGLVYQVNLPFFNSTFFNSLLPFSVGCLLSNITIDSKEKKRIEMILGVNTLFVVCVVCIFELDILGNFDMVLLFSFFPLCILTLEIMHDKLKPKKISLLENIDSFLRDISMPVFLFNLPVLLLVRILDLVFELNLCYCQLFVLVIVLLINILYGTAVYLLRKKMILFIRKFD